MIIPSIWISFKKSNKGEIVRFLPLTHLKGDEILAVDIIDVDKKVLLKKGTILSESLVYKIKKYGILSVYVESPYQEILKSNISDTIKPMKRYESVSNVKNSLETFIKKVQLQKKFSKYGDTGADLVNTLKAISEDLIDEVLLEKNIMIAMQDIKSLSNYYYQHAVNVAVLSLIIGTEIGLTTREMEDLAVGALLIDSGCCGLNQEILTKKDVYTSEERKLMQNHVLKGYEQINENTNVNAHVKSIIMHHHERNDGSGYPKGLTDKDIHPLAKIVMIADVYDALTSDRPNRPAHSQHEAIEYIMANAGTKFDFNLVNIFSRRIVPYPVGSYVLLSNEQSALITENNPSFPLRPKVRTFGKSKYTGRNEVMMDLMKNNNITIVKTIYDIS